MTIIHSTQLCIQILNVHVEPILKRTPWMKVKYNKCCNESECSRMIQRMFFDVLRLSILTTLATKTSCHVGSGQSLYKSSNGRTKIRTGQG